MKQDLSRFWGIASSALALLAGGCAESESDLGPAGASPPAFSCSALGQAFLCEGNVAVACEDASLRTDCAADGRSCLTGLGCVSCQPGTGSCSGGHATACRSDGSGTFEFECDATQGMTCNPDGCAGACSPATLGESYVGCDYYPTVTANSGLYWKGFTFAVAVANTTGEPANVMVTRGLETVASRTVAAHGLEMIPLPWVMELKGEDPSMGIPVPLPTPKVVSQAAYRLRSDNPVTVYQFNPLEYEIAPAPKDCPGSAGGPEGCFSYSNDASLLLPAHVLGRDYLAMSWNGLGCKSGFVSVTATEDGTEIELDPVGQFDAGGGFDEKGHGKAKLDRGDVIQLSSVSLGGPFCFNAEGSDISGSLVRASRPVQVIAGHACANLPTPKTEACDHLEEAMFPLETLGKDHVVAVPAGPDGKVSPHTIRILAPTAGAKVFFDPPIEPPATLVPGVPFEVNYVDQDVRVMATAPVLVAAFMQGSHSVPTQTGDPSESLAVPSEQFRNQYVFLAPKNYDVNFVSVVAKHGAKVELDGEVVPAGAFSPVGASGFGVARVKLAPTEIHRAEGDSKFGISVYGYGRYTSYMYPGGLNLTHIAPTPH